MMQNDPKYKEAYDRANRKADQIGVKTYILENADRDPDGLTCEDCLFHSKEHFKGEEGIDCFSEEHRSKDDSPFTCLREAKSYFHTKQRCPMARITPTTVKFKRALKALSKT